MNLYRNVRSPYGGAHAGKWPIFADVHDVRYAYFQDPDTKVWHRLEWEQAAGLGQPFSQAAADYTKQIAVRTQRHVDPQQAVADLVAQWSRGEVQSRRDRSLARRISAQRADTTAGEPLPAERDEARQVASLPGVIDLLEHRERKPRWKSSMTWMCSTSTTPSTPTPRGWRCSTIDQSVGAVVVV